MNLPNRCQGYGFVLLIFVAYIRRICMCQYMWILDDDEYDEIGL